MSVSTRLILGANSTAQSGTSNFVEPTAKKTALSNKILQASFKSSNNLPVPAKPVFLISIGQKHKAIPEEQYLNSIVALVNSKISELKLETVTVIAAGVLQRHNWWLFTPNYSDEELAKHLRDLPVGLNHNQFAEVLAEKFLPDAEALEQKYIQEHQHIFDQLPNVFTIKKWFDVVPGDLIRNKSSKINTFAHQLYANYSNKVVKLFNTNEQFQVAIKKTIQDFIQRDDNAEQIEAQSKRIIAANSKLAALNFIEIAKASCCNYLLEECPYLIPVLNKQGFNQVYYPGKITPALATTKELLQKNDEILDIEWVQINLKSVNTAKRLKAIEQNQKIFTQMGPGGKYPFFKATEEHKSQENSPVKAQMAAIDNQVEELVLQQALQKGVSSNILLNLYKADCQKRLNFLLTQLDALGSPRSLDEAADSTTSNLNKPPI